MMAEPEFGMVEGEFGAVPALPPPPEEGVETVEGAAGPLEDGPVVVGPPAVVAQPFPGPGAQQRDAETQPVWLIVMAVYLGLGLLGIATATRRLRVTEPRAARTAPPAVVPPGVSAPVPDAQPSPGVRAP